MIVFRKILSKLFISREINGGVGDFPLLHELHPISACRWTSMSETLGLQSSHQAIVILQAKRGENACEHMLNSMGISHDMFELKNNIFPVRKKCKSQSLHPARSLYSYPIILNKYFRDMIDYDRDESSKEQLPSVEIRLSIQALDLLRTPRERGWKY